MRTSRPRTRLCLDRGAIPVNREDENRNRFPEIGNFPQFWLNYKILGHNPPSTAEYERSLAYGQTLFNMFGPLNFENDIEKFLRVGDKVASLLGNPLPDRDISADIIKILNISCSLRSHPFWNSETENTQDFWKRKRDKCWLKGHVCLVLWWFCEHCPSRNAVMPSYVRASIIACERTFKEVSGDGWESRNEPSFEDWTSFLRRKGCI